MSDSLLRDRIALGIPNEDARERLFQERKLHLKRGIDICRASKSATTHLQAFGGKNEESAGCTEGPMIFPRRTVNRVNELKLHLKKKHRATRAYLQLLLAVSCSEERAMSCVE